MARATEARRMIERHGRSVTLRRFASASYSPATREVADGTASTTVTKAVLHKVRQSAIDGVSVLQDDLFALVPSDGLSFAPERGHELVDGSVTYKVMGVRPVPYGAGMLAYDLQLRA